MPAANTSSSAYIAKKRAANLIAALNPGKSFDVKTSILLAKIESVLAG
jgi:hypothetical protein